MWCVASFAYPTFTRLREFAEKRIWQQRRGLVVTRCRHSVLYRRSREAPAANQRHYRDSTLNICWPDFTFQSQLCQYNQS